MNQLCGTISNVTTSGNISLVDIIVGDVPMTSVIIGTPPGGNAFRDGGPIDVLFNESEVSIGRMEDGCISLSNQLPCAVESVIPGEILTQVILSFKGAPLTSLITTRSVKRLDLKPGSFVTAFIKATEVLLKETRNAD